MTDEERLAASLCVYLIPKRYVRNEGQERWMQSMPDYVPAGYMHYNPGTDNVKMYCFGSYLNTDGGVREGYCQSAFVPAGELGQYQVGSNNKHKRLETYIQRRQR